MRYNPLIILPMFSLALFLPVKAASAIGITLDPFGPNFALAQVNPAGSPTSFSDSVPITGVGNYQPVQLVLTTSGSAFASGDFTFSNGATTAAFIGATSISDTVNPMITDPTHMARVRSILTFTLTEPVYYSIAGTFNASFLGGMGTIQAQTTAVRCLARRAGSCKALSAWRSGAAAHLTSSCLAAIGAHAHGRGQPLLFGPAV